MGFAHVPPGSASDTRVAPERRPQTGVSTGGLQVSQRLQPSGHRAGSAPVPQAWTGTTRCPGVPPARPSPSLARPYPGAPSLPVWGAPRGRRLGVPGARAPPERSGQRGWHPPAGGLCAEFPRRNAPLPQWAGRPGARASYGTRSASGPGEGGREKEGSARRAARGGVQPVPSPETRPRSRALTRPGARGRAQALPGRTGPPPSMPAPAAPPGTPIPWWARGPGACAPGSYLRPGEGGRARRAAEGKYSSGERRARLLAGGAVRSELAVRPRPPVHRVPRTCRAPRAGCAFSAAVCARRGAAPVRSLLPPSP